MQADLNTEIDRNFIAFQAVVSRILSDHRGSFAVMRNQDIVQIHRSFGEAIHSAHSEFADGVFSIQEVTDQPMDLGFFSHASPLR